MAKAKGNSKAGFGAGAKAMGGPGKKPMPPFMSAKKAPMAPDMEQPGYKKGGVVKGKK